MIDIRWSDRYLLGYEKIDLQHRVFVDLIRSTSDAIDRQLDLALVRDRLEEFARYAEFHFFSEEELIIGSGYPDAEVHMNEHRLLLSTLKEKIKRYLRNPNDGESLVIFMFDWFVNHTQDVDRKLAAYLVQQEQTDN